MQRTRCIGVFDSGFGGLDVLRAIVRALPDYDYVYLGDSARAPYGHRLQKTIYRYTKEAVDFLFKKGAGIVIIACNTSSSRALRKIQDEYGSRKKVLGVLIPAAEEAVLKTKNKRVGVIATKATVASEKFVRELQKLDPHVRIYQEACPLLVPLVEDGKENSPEMARALKKYLHPLLKQRVDTLILGCTHYGIIERQIRAIAGPRVAVVSQARVVPKKLRSYLRRHREIEKRLCKSATVSFYTTDRTGNFKTHGDRFYGRPIRVTKISL